MTLNAGIAPSLWEESQARLSSWHITQCRQAGAALLGQQLAFDAQRTLVLGLLNAVVGVSLFQFLDKLRKAT